MRKRRWPWLVGAVVLIGLAALLMRVGEGAPKPKPTWDRVDIPRRARHADKERQEQRQTLEPSLPPKAVAGETQRPARPRDPVLAALGGEFKKAAMVMEANAVRNSPVGQLLVDCINSADDGERMRRVKEQTGIDPLTDLDRIAVTDKMVVLSGDFKKMKEDAFSGSTATQFGERGTLYELDPHDGGRVRHAATWDGQMVLLGDNPEQLKETLERIEGTRPMESGGLSDQSAYGEIYGVLSPEELGEIFEETNPGLGQRLAQVAQRVELHIDTSGDVGVAARVDASSSEEAKEMSKALGAAMAMARLKAQSEGKTDVADLLDMGRVVTDGSDFRLEAGVPQVWLEKALKKCVERNQARRRARQTVDSTNQE